MKLRRNCAYLVRTRGGTFPGVFQGYDRHLAVFKRNGKGRNVTVKVKRSAVLQLLADYRGRELPAPRIPLRRESKTHASTKRSRWCETPPGKRARVKGGNAKPVRYCECFLCGGTK